MITRYRRGVTSTKQPQYLLEPISGVDIKQVEILA
jgi:hypothetical protein